jgi:RNA polymerase sigma-70 factor, ECF subfamily
MISGMDRSPPSPPIRSGSGPHGPRSDLRLESATQIDTPLPPTERASLFRNAPGRAGPPDGWARPVDLTAELRRALDGDQEAFRLLYRDVQPRLLRYLGALVGDDAEDVASETWLQVARDLDRFSGDYDGFRGWVATIGRNRAADHLRRARRRPSQAPVTAEHMELWAASDDTAVSALESVSTDEAMRLIASLPQDQAEAVLLRVVLGLDAGAAGKVLGKRPGAVRTASYRGLRRIAADLERARGVTPEGQQALKGTR